MTHQPDASLLEIDTRCNNCGKAAKRRFTTWEVESKEFPITDKTWTCPSCYKWITMNDKMIADIQLQYQLWQQGKAKPVFVNTTSNLNYVEYDD